MILSAAKFIRPSIVALALVCSSCQSPTTSNDPGKSDSLILPSRYSGVLPCADCPGIRYTLDLRRDHSYVLRMEYLERDVSRDSTGRWSFIDKTRTLTLQDEGSSSELFAVRGATLRKLDRVGRPIDSTLNYELTREADYAPLEARLASRGVAYLLEGTRWVPVEIANRQIHLQSGQREPFIAFTADSHRVAGNVGCNRATGAYEVDSVSLHIRELVSTRMACPFMQLETAFVQALESTATFRIVDSRLELLDDKGEVLARLEARNL